MIYTIALFDSNDKIVEVITFDSVTNFNEDYDASAPQSAVESGYNLTDNLSLSNDKYSLSGVVSDSVFNTDAGLVQYLGGEFVPMYDEVEESGIVSDKPSLVVKNRLRELRVKREHFGLIISTDIYKLGGSQGSIVEVIYPCLMTKLSFRDDGTDAVYPDMNFEKVRISTTAFVKVDNPTPELIPYAKDAVNLGNKTGKTTSISTEVPSSEIEEAKKQASQMGLQDLPKSADTYAEMEKSRNRFAAEAAKEASAKNMNYSETRNHIDKSVESKMIAKYGIAWKARLSL